MTTQTKALRFALTGPGVENLSYGTAGGALSRAITAAEARGKKNAATFLVHDVTGELVGRVDHDDDGNTQTWRAPFIGAMA